MMRKAVLCWVIGAMVGAGFAVPARGEGTPVAAARGGGGCAARVASNVYACNVIKSDGSTFKDCLRFATPGKVSDLFDVTPDQLGIPLGCTCKASGSKKRPKFAGSPVFVCNSNDYAFEGMVSGNGKTISKGIANLAAGASFVFSCKLDANCAL